MAIRPHLQPFRQTIRRFSEEHRRRSIPFDFRTFTHLNRVSTRRLSGISRALEANNVTRANRLTAALGFSVSRRHLDTVRMLISHRRVHPAPIESPPAPPRTETPPPILAPLSTDEKDDDSFSTSRSHRDDVAPDPTYIVEQSFASAMFAASAHQLLRSHDPLPQLEKTVLADVLSKIESDTDKLTFLTRHLDASPRPFLAHFQGLNGDVNTGQRILEKQEEVLLTAQNARNLIEAAHSPHMQFIFENVLLSIPQQERETYTQAAVTLLDTIEGDRTKLLALTKLRQIPHEDRLHVASHTLPLMQTYPDSIKPLALDITGQLNKTQREILSESAPSILEEVPNRIDRHALLSVIADNMNVSDPQAIEDSKTLLQAFESTEGKTAVITTFSTLLPSERRHKLEAVETLISQLETEEAKIQVVNTVALISNAHLEEATEALLDYIAATPESELNLLNVVTEFVPRPTTHEVFEIPALDLGGTVADIDDMTTVRIDDSHTLDGTGLATVVPLNL